MKKFLLMLFVCFLGVGVVSAQENYSDVGFKEEILVSSADFKGYAELYIYGIDVRGMGVKKIDTDGDVHEESAEADVLENIAFSLGDAFSTEINKVLPVVKQEEALNGIKSLKGKKALILDIKLAYERSIEEVGALTKFLLKKEETVVSDKGLRIECSFRDADSGKTLLRLTQNLAFNIENNNRPFAGEKDQEGLEKLIKAWARRTALVLAQKRGN